MGVSIKVIWILRQTFCNLYSGPLGQSWSIIPTLTHLQKKAGKKQKSGTASLKSVFTVSSNWRQMEWTVSPTWFHYFVLLKARLILSDRMWGFRRCLICQSVIQSVILSQKVWSNEMERARRKNLPRVWISHNLNLM